MNINRQLITACFIVILMGGCNSEPSTEYIFPKYSTTDFKDIIGLEKTGKKILQLDSTIGITNQSIVSFREDSVEKISIFNSYDISLHIYNYESGELQKKIKFNTEGPNGIGKTSNMGHFMENSDSIFLFNHWENRVYLMNKNAEVIRKFDLTDASLPYEFYLMINPAAPVFMNAQKLYIPTQSFGAAMKDTQYLIELDLLTGVINRNINGAEFLDQAFWGPVTPYGFTLTFNSRKSTVVTSQSKDPKVRVYDLGNLETIKNEQVVGSKHVDSFASFEKKNSKPPMFGHDYKQIASITNRDALFTSLIYDYHNRLFYRLMVLPRTQEQYELRQKGLEMTIIILNEDLEKLGESKIPTGEYLPNFFFINQNGLHLASLAEYEKNEETLVFDIYEPTDK